MKHMNTKEAAHYLGLSYRTLERWRVEGFGPEFIKLGKRVVYSVAVLDQWLKNNSFSSTSAYIQ